MSAVDERALSLADRLWIYQSERFPLLKTGVLLGAFTSASINVSAMLAGRPFPSIWVYAAAWLVVLIVFFQMRAADEWKDLGTDRRYRPGRPIPRGLISLRLIIALGLGLGPVAVVAAISVSPALVTLLLVVWLWFGLMTLEFFAPDWLKARPVVYLVSHMLIMPLIDLFVTGAEWLPAAGMPPAWLWLFLLLSFVNGCVIEIGRKLYAPVNERPGVETYTALWGINGAVVVWCACLLVSYGLLVVLGAILKAPVVVALAGGLGLAVALWGAQRFASEPTPKRQELVDTLAGLWVLVCYLTSGFLPIIVGGAP